VITAESRYRRRRFPIEIVKQCVWLYFRFALSYRNIEEMIAKRGIQVTYETVREWCHKFGSLYAAQLRKRRARFGTKWYLDEVFIKMNGVQHYLWRAVDQNGVVIDISGATETGPLGSFALLPQATPYGRENTTGHHHRQTTELRRSKEVDLA
jgi:transposase-like protein